jgi:hypothetical protein
MTSSTHELQVDHKLLTVTISVNRRLVTFSERHATGSEIKATAITQGVPIQQDFALFEVKGQGKLKSIGDDERVSLNDKDEFRAIAPDDAS